MGRLFWKFFLLIWLAQLSASLGVGVWFWWEREQHHALQTAPDSPPPNHLAPPHGKPRHPPPPLGVPPPVLIAALLASLLFASLSAWYFSRPIRSLQQALSNAARGRLSDRPGASMGQRKDELAELGHQFDQMAIRLEALIQAQKQLLGNVSHELRSPLARIQVAIGLARQQPLLVEKTLDRLEREAHQMDELIGELLTLSRLGGGTSDIQELIELPELLLSIVEDIRFEWAEKPLRLHLPEIPPIKLQGDSLLLQRALENVIRNAVKFAPEGSEIRLEIFADTQELVLRVLDQGPGVPADLLHQIFQPFVRCESPDRPRKEGHGLGLAIAKAVVQRMGGRISARNRQETPDACGLCVEITLPVYQPSSAQSRIA